MKNQVLSIEQMRHLRELGVDTSKASMLWIKSRNGIYTAFSPNGNWSLSMNTVGKDKIQAFREVVPAFTLQDIIELLPNGLRLVKGKSYDGEYWVCNVLNNPDVVPEITVNADGRSALEAAYRMLCWCVENGYLKGGEK